MSMRTKMTWCKNSWIHQQNGRWFSSIKNLTHVDWSTEVWGICVTRKGILVVQTITGECRLFLVLCDALIYHRSRQGVKASTFLPLTPMKRGTRSRKGHFELFWALQGNFLCSRQAPLAMQFNPRSHPRMSNLGIYNFTNSDICLNPATPPQPVMKFNEGFNLKILWVEN